MREHTLTALRIVAACLLRQRARWSTRHVGIVLCYHAVGQRSGDPATELNAAVAVEDLRRHVRHARRAYDVVAASQISARAAARRPWQRLPLAITFDDDLPSHAEYAAPVLTAAGVPATFFLTGEGLSGDAPFWWQALQRAWDAGRVDAGWLRTLGGPEGAPSLRTLAATIQRMTPERRAAVTIELRRLAGPGPVPDLLGADGIRTLVAAGFEMGFHTRRHDDLRTVTAAQLASVMDEGRSEIEDITGPLEVIAYPHGGVNASVAAAARRAGFTNGFVADGSAVVSGADPFKLGRRYPKNGGRGRFELDLAWTLARARQPS